MQRACGGILSVPALIPLCPPVLQYHRVRKQPGFKSVQVQIQLERWSVQISLSLQLWTPFPKLSWTHDKVNEWVGRRQNLPEA